METGANVQLSSP